MLELHCKKRHLLSQPRLEAAVGKCHFTACSRIQKLNLGQIRSTWTAQTLGAKSFFPIAQAAAPVAPHSELDIATTQTWNGCDLKKKRLTLCTVFILSYKHDLSVEIKSTAAKFIRLNTN